ncbi:MAG: glycosyltransferase family 4 protein [Candidatus Nanoarchaeia archaeon]|jgi:glycosyltransferase involved in cell wall biosynthesis
MRLLMLSWRDINNPNKGGAEVYTYEILKRLVKKGHKITWFAASWPGCKEKEVIDGIEIIRRGSFFSVYLKSYKYYKIDFKGKFDLIIDQINTVPFFTPLFIKEKKIALIFQLARELWFKETTFPINIAGYLTEPFYLSLYKKQKMITISESTKQELLKLGLKDVNIIPVGLSIKSLNAVPKKDKRFRILYIGRLKKSKGVHDIIKALRIVRETIKDAKLDIVGRGDYEIKLKRLVGKLGLKKYVKFHGFVSEEKKNELMKSSHVICAASKREGWGMIVTEANALGTPAIVYNSPGLRDAVKDGYNGLITKKNDPLGISDCIISLHKNKQKYLKMCSNSLKYAAEFNWETAAKLFEEVIKNEFIKKNV